MSGDDLFLLVVRYVTIFLIACVPCCTADNMYSNYTRMQVIRDGADPLEVACIGHMETQNCALLITKDHKE